MNALVTGGAGFIGSHIAEALCRRGHWVRVLDNLTTGNLQNLGWRQPGDEINFVEGDIRDMELVTRVVQGCDVVFHEAAVASVPRSVEDPVGTNDHNLNGTLIVLTAAREARVRRFVFASSSAVYGASTAACQKENDALDPLSPYALHKAAGEQYCRMFWRLYGLETVALRYFNIFGPRQAFDSPYSGVIAKFCTAFLEKTAPTIFGDGQQTRDFSYVANVVHANLLAAEAPAERVAGRVFNVGSGNARSVLDLWNTLSSLTGFCPSLQFAPARAGDVRHSVASLDIARRELGYEVQVGWEEGLRRTLEYYRAKTG
ncbi:MAG TPA: SDR family oxidoreductase [Verrucomicrobiota bacterium]|nr:SDR family oxidoreductase [Verrucomicrobiota bacterium]